jgi:hypothetical protein
MKSTIPHFVQLAAGDNEEAFWIQLLVIVILAAGVGVFGVIKKHRARYGSARELIRRIFGTLRRRTSEFRPFDLVRRFTPQVTQAGQAIVHAIRRTQTKLGNRFNPVAATLKIENRKSMEQESLPTARTSRPTRSEAQGPLRKSGSRDFNSGMELLTRDFLVEVVERTGSVEMHDVTMRNLCFTELVRRGELGAVSSDALKTYTLNTEGVFDKSIRYQAMKELAGRTTRTQTSPKL